ncbi:SDR family oxidoreductase [Frondihabitans peucedani]|uniref:SDR family oxidoreductase n=1 Tax=Frondihabitans peucedani TaxID=598626 RepID=A0ABP8E1Y8_9MICO
MEFENDRVLVTGVGQAGSLGHEIAVAFSKLGAYVVASGRSAKAEQELLDVVGPDRTKFIQVDLLDPGSARDLARRAGDVTILVNNAATIEAGSTSSITDDGFDAMFAVNVKAAHQLVAELQPGMARAQRGSIVNISSIGAKLGTPGRAAYAASKAALESLTRSWGVEFASDGITVNAVAPGPLLNPRLRAAGGAAIAAAGSTVPAGRPVRTREVADVVVFLASQKARYATGSTLALDGGRTVI